jgi:thiol-disulfide isomerase/thioredoxin
MSDIQDKQTAGQEGRKAKRRGPGPLLYAIAGLVVIGAAAALYVIAPHVGKPAAGSSLKTFAHGDLANLTTASAGQAAPDTVFIDAGGRPMHLSDLKGHVLVVNLWATWCGPCVKEMPALAKLQADYPGRILVVPVSMDKADDREKARAFIAQNSPLPFYEDEKSAMAFALSPPAEGFPTTVIYDASGHEKARLADGADWTGADAHALIDAVLKGS